MNKKCTARLQSGKACRYVGKIEFGGYCGVHKHLMDSKRPLSNEQRDARLVRILGAGAQLQQSHKKSDYQSFCDVIHDVEKLMVAGRSNIPKKAYAQMLKIQQELRTLLLHEGVISSEAQYASKKKSYLPPLDDREAFP